MWHNDYLGDNSKEGFIIKIITFFLVWNEYMFMVETSKNINFKRWNLNVSHDWVSQKSCWCILEGFFFLLASQNTKLAKAQLLIEL